jgi:acetyl esterase/lipase
MNRLFLSFIFSLMFMTLQAQNETFNLYEGAIPNSKPADNIEKTNKVQGEIQFTYNISIPTLSRYNPIDSLKNGTVVIICPGGGYVGVADDHEGVQVAKAFNRLGVTAFVLKYRNPSSRTMVDESIGPLQDAQQAVRIVRQNAEKWKLNPTRIGIMGFSAGGHLAATATTHFQAKADPSVSDTISVRPDFSMLIYPVISFKDEITHLDSRTNLIGQNPSFEKIYAYSNEEQITPQTPPVFLVHAADDDVVKVENSLIFYQNCLKNKVSAELHLYPKGGHGFGMVNKTTKDLWMERAENWLESLGFLKK